MHSQLPDGGWAEHECVQLQFKLQSKQSPEGALIYEGAVIYKGAASVTALTSLRWE